MHTFTKEQIEIEVKRNHLIESNYDVNQIKECCYLARTSERFFDLTNQEAKRIDLDGNDYFVLRPNNSVVCKTFEKFNIPNNVLARVILTGHYFSLGIAPVCTYADPGFSGYLGIVLTNTSKNYLIIKIHEPLVKIEFSYISGESRPYEGQHGGDLEVWPYRKHLIATKEQLINKGIIENSLSELKRVYGDDVAETIYELRTTKKYIAAFVTLCAVVPLFLVWGINYKFNMNSPHLSALIGIATGVVGNIIFFLVLKMFKK